MCRHIFYIITAFAAVLSASAETLTLEDCRQKALDYNKSLVSSRLLIQKQEYELKAMKTNFLPNFKVYAADFYNTGKITPNSDFAGVFAGGIANAKSVLASLAANPLYTPLVAGLQSIAQGFAIPEDMLELKIGNVFAAGVSVVEPLYAGGKITAGYKMNKVGVSMARSKVRLTEQEVILNTDQAYVLCIKAKEMGDVARSYKTLLEELQKNVESAVRHGMRTKNDVLKVQVKLNEAELNIVKADNAYRLAQMNLAQIVGLPLTQRIDVTTDGIYIPIDNATVNGQRSMVNDLSLDISQRPEYDLLNDKTEMARLQVKLTRSEFLPNLAVFGSYGYVNGVKFLGERLLKNGSATVGVILKIPLFHFGEWQHKVRSAKASYQISQMEQEDLNEKMQLELLQAANLVQESALEVSITNKSVEQAEENMRMSRKQYDVGVEPLSDYLEAQTLWQQACASAVDARCNYLLSYTKYLKAKGGM